MMFNALCQSLDISVTDDFNVSGLSLNSKELQKDEIFVALSGTKEHGLRYAKDAVAQGASAILFEKDNETVVSLDDCPVPCIVVENLSHKVSKLASIFYGDPSKTMQVLAVTGTNGKSSIAYGLAAMCAQYLGKTAVVGTVGFGVNGVLEKASHTTPDAVALQKILKNFETHSVKYVVMEASSHGLELGRMEAVEVETALYTNLSRDHQDFHETMENYAQAKQKLFVMPSVKNAVIHCNDDFGKQLADRYEATLRVVRYGVEIDHAGEYLSAESLEQHSSGSTFILSSSWGELSLTTGLLGRFNVENILAMIGGFLLAGGDFAKVSQAVSEIQPLQGRMECFGGAQFKQPLVVVDYAHTPDALGQSLQALRAHMNTDGALYCVFGCGGDRDKGKRPEMAAAVQNNADYAVVTDDNPRTEAPESIVADIMQGFTEDARVNVVHDRGQAIFGAVHSAKAGDMVLVAGKGHESEQIIGVEKHHFSDAEKVQEALC